MYVWGGGWNENDTGAGRETCTLGVSPHWAAFARKQTASYDYRTTRYQIHDGLDCSGYVGWCIYNLLHTPLSNTRQHCTYSHPEATDAAQSCFYIGTTAHASNNSTASCGYVMPAHQMAANFSDRGWGTFIPRNQITDYRAGDIMSSRGHVWIVVGQCSDGSVVLLHSSPPGVQLCGTPCLHSTPSPGVRLCGTPCSHPAPSPGVRLCGTPCSHSTPLTGGTAPSVTSSPLTNHVSPADASSASQAICLANYYMSSYYTDWYRRYPDCARDSSYLSDYDQMRWDASGNAVLIDPEGFQKMSASAVLENLFTR